MAELLVATQSFTGRLDGGIFTAQKDATRVLADHPAARKWPQFFGPLEPTESTRLVKPVVEQATKAPGEKRGR